MCYAHQCMDIQGIRVNLVLCLGYSDIDKNYICNYQQLCCDFLMLQVGVVSCNLYFKEIYNHEV